MGEQKPLSRARLLPEFSVGKGFTANQVSRVTRYPG